MVCYILFVHSATAFTSFMTTLQAKDDVDTICSACILVRVVSIRYFRV